MKAGALPLLLSAVALCAAVFAVARESDTHARAPMRSDRVAALEAQVDALRHEVESLRRDRRQSPGPDAAISATEEARDAPRGIPARALEDGALEAIVESAVDRKTEEVLDELRVKSNKKPTMALFAAMLELSPAQHEATVRVVAEGQRQVSEILETPMANGAALMDELVELAAREIAEPGKDHGWGPWLGRVMTEKIPGTTQTYGERIEAVKSDMNRRFKQDWSKEQYKEYKEWEVDPTEIEKVPGSTYEALEKRILERARELGAEIPAK